MAGLALLALSQPVNLAQRAQDTSPVLDAVTVQYACRACAGCYIMDI